MGIKGFTFSVIAALLFVLEAGASASGLLESAGDDWHSLASWSERDGLPSGRIRAITQDATGYLWLGTESGLVRFDGVRFVPWAPDDGTLRAEELGGVTALCPAAGGGLWLGFHDGGVGRIRGRPPAAVRHIGRIQSRSCALCA
jgi:ligand-binding sensor domain-containing protein